MRLLSLILKKTLDDIRYLFRTKDISGERLYEHLKNMGIDASPPVPIKRRLKFPVKYGISIRLKGLNVDEIHIERCVAYGGGASYSDRYYIDYIVRDFERERWHLKRKLKELSSSILSLVPIDIESKVRISPEKGNRFIRIQGLVSPNLTAREEVIVQKEGKRVRREYLKDEFLPSRETIAAYDSIALRIRKILEGGDSAKLPI